MKILLINKNHFVHGGADRVYLNTGKLLEENGHQVAYFSTLNIDNISTEFDRYFVSSIETRQNSFFKKILSVKKYIYNEEAKNKLGQLIKDFNPDIIHIHLFYGVMSASILKEVKKHNIPIVATIHDYRLICPTNNMLDSDNLICEKCLPSSPSYCLIKKCSEKSLSQSAVVTLEAYFRKYVFKPIDYIDNFIFVSNFIKNKHIQVDYRYEGKSSQLYNFAPEISLDTSKKGSYLLYFGRLSKEKGLFTLIKSLFESKHKLKIVGSGPLENEMLELIHTQNNIEFLGFKSGKELDQLILNSSFVVVPSEWYENNPMTIIESFALGKPVIGANIGGIPELLNRSNGFLFESSNVKNLSEVIDNAIDINEDLYQNLSKNCLGFAKKFFSKENHYFNLLNIYKSIKK
jgi:glycosyltransferase involved in cell wall biosynthesis